MTVRTIAETLSRNLVFRRSFSGRFAQARIVTSPEAGLRYWRRNIDDADPILLDAAGSLVKAGSVVWDVGANVGLFTIAAAALAGPKGEVISIEADEWLNSLVSRSIDLNRGRIAPIRQVTAAVTDREGFAEFHIAKRSRSSNFLAGCGASQSGGIRASRLVPTTTLDKLAERFSPPGVLKIDVEGAELLVLSGGKKLLSEARPTIFCEVSREHAEAVTRLLTQELHYQLFDAGEGLARIRPVGTATWNTLAVHRHNSVARVACHGNIRCIS
jgi:FkbM family methyltransferase